MYKVKELYVPYSDGDGHTYLIPRKEWRRFEKWIEHVEDSYAAHDNYEIYIEELNEVLEHFCNTQLEGQRHYIMLESDLLGGIDAK